MKQEQTDTRITNPDSAEDYADIIAMPYPPQRRDDNSRRTLSLAMRAAQFSPFAALTGLDDAINGTQWEGETPDLAEEEV